jgi:hypothetical protein
MAEIAFERKQFGFSSQSQSELGEFRSISATILSPKSTMN